MLLLRLRLRCPEGRMPRSTLHSVSLPHLALGSTPACSARDAAHGCPLLVSACGYLRAAAAWLLALPGPQPPASRDAQLPALPGAARGRCVLAPARVRCLPVLSRSHHRATIYKHHQVAASGELHVSASLHSPSNKEMFTLKLHVASVCFSSVSIISEVCCKCFVGMLQK
jgi:hypothetical protein